MLHNLQRIARELFETDFAASARAHLSISLTAAPLVPLDDGEILLPGTHVRREDRIGTTGTSVEDEENWIILILTSYLNPWVNPADSDKSLLHNPAGAFNL